MIQTTSSDSHYSLNVDGTYGSAPLVSSVESTRGYGGLPDAISATSSTDVVVRDVVSTTMDSEADLQKSIQCISQGYYKRPKLTKMQTRNGPDFHISVSDSESNEQVVTGLIQLPPNK